MILIGALPFLFSTPAYAEENRWLDDYHQPVGLTYGAQATVQTSYLWRGLYAGAMNLQLDANVGYGGLYLDMWWNLGTEDWSFRKFQPEVDFSLGFARWGLDVYVLYIHNFNCGFFDFHNYADRGNRLELNARYTVSSKLPLSILWATRLSAADGYINAAGDLVFAYSSYLELSYTQKFPYDIKLFGAVGMTPWRSCYTSYKGNFAVNNITLRLSKDWSLHDRCGIQLFGAFVINPWAVANDRTSAEWHPKSPGNQSVNLNLGAKVYLK